MYQPREDSFLLERNVENLAFGKVLDMGTGTGILAIAAAKNQKVKSVMAADINKEAILYVLDVCVNEGMPVTVIQSNLFENIDEKFDTIIFNPPYLPNDGPKDYALDGGEKGHELTEKFLMDAKTHLNENGQILLLFSSLTNKDIVDAILRRENYKFEQVDSMKMDFEELYIYVIN
ncbi:MAG: methyltransferase [Nanoarchaeota archaeon]|nr:methyltransferase [Nanoarchaeota archaeon]